MKIVGLLVDNYKESKFIEECKALNFTIIDNSNFVPIKGVKLIRLAVRDEEVKDVANLCQKMELHFKRSN